MRLPRRRGGRRMSLRLQLALVFVAFTAVVLLIQDVPLAAYLRGVERDRIVTGLERDAFTLAGRSETVLEATTPAAVADLQTPIDDYARASGARVVVTDDGGAAVVTSDRTSTGEDFANRPEVQSALSGGTASGRRPSTTLGEDLLYVAVPVRSGTSILGAVRLTYPAAVVDAAVERRVRNLLLVGLVTLGSAAVIGLFVASVVTGRLRRFKDATERIAAGDLGARVGPQRGEELDALATSFDAMADRVEHLVTAQRGFAADASHQLRTPLTALRLRLDRTAELVDSDPVGALENLDAVRAETDRMQRLVDGLLTLARADARGVHVIGVDVVPLLHERVEVWRALAEERGVTLELDAPEQAWVLAVPGAVDQIVDNYVDNALEVAPPESVVAVTVVVDREIEPSSVVIGVADRGPGLSEVDRERAFDRFWRGDAAPGSREPGGTGPGGSGLGLAIVRTLARASGGTVELREREGSGLVATITLRAARPSPSPVGTGSGTRP